MKKKVKSKKSDPPIKKPKTFVERWLELHYPDIAARALPGLYYLLEDYADKVTADLRDEVEYLRGELNCS